MKKVICIAIVLSFAIPMFTFAAETKPYTEQEVDEILKDLYQKEGALKETTDAYLGCVKKNSELTEENRQLREHNEWLKKTILDDREADKRASKTAKWLLGGMGAWGIVTAVSTGTAYPFIAGMIFLEAATR